MYMQVTEHGGQYNVVNLLGVVPALTERWGKAECGRKESVLHNRQKSKQSNYIVSRVFTQLETENFWTLTIKDIPGKSIINVKGSRMA